MQGLRGKESACNAEVGSVPRLGRSPGEGNGNHSSILSNLENLMDRGAWKATVHGVAKESDETDVNKQQQASIAHLVAISSPQKT